MKPTNSESPPVPAPAFSETSDRILVHGIHLEVTEALRNAALKKGARLFRHQTQLVRVRLDLEYQHAHDDQTPFVARGRIEISGPDIVASVSSDDAYKSLDLLIDRLDRMLRERTRTRKDQRNNRPAGTEFRDQLAQPT